MSSPHDPPEWVRRRNRRNRQLFIDRGYRDMDTDITSAAGIILLNFGDIYVSNVKLKDVSIIESFF